MSKKNYKSELEPILNVVKENRIHRTDQINVYLCIRFIEFEFKMDNLFTQRVTDIIKYSREEAIRLYTIPSMSLMPCKRAGPGAGGRKIG